MLSALALSAILTGPPALVSQEPRVRLAATCFKTGEDAPQGSMTKICYYNCLGSPVAITIGAVALCPLTIDR